MNNIKDFNCPVCDGNDFEIIEEVEEIDIPFSDDNQIKLIKLKCNECETITEYSKLFDEDYNKAIEKYKKISVENMLESLSNKGYNLAAIERALELPQRTISRWKNTGELSSTGLALLRIISTYPWILNVAQNKFDPIYAKSTFIHNAVSDFFTMYSTANNIYFSQFGFFINPTNLFIIAKYDLKDSVSSETEAEEIVSPLQISSSEQSAFTEVII